MARLMKRVALIVAAGKGERAGVGLPKQFARIGGKALVAHAVDRFAAHPAITDILVVIGAGQEELLREALQDSAPVTIVTGGAERQDSVRAGLEAMDDAGQVFIHDAARPFLPASVLDRLIAALDGAEGAIPALPVVDTLARNAEGLGEVVDRATLVRVQTPQAFHFATILAAHRAWTGTPATDDAQMVRALGRHVAVVAGDSALDKLTYPSDFAAAERLHSKPMISRTGMGFDVHRLERGEELWLCGVKLDHSHGLSGHSDADVALHALVDALLGAAALGDIGQHFPPSEARWKGADSSIFLTHARDLLAETGAIIDHVDVTIICEAPKIGPHRDRMRARVADLLRLSLTQVSIKATTTERLGLTGRGEGIAAQALATIRTKE
jgi:2-C-methyl-D-erythritol 4-phosphate cytidylyltransferase/2-C-methyl-D-erythritol 2,4-cyclodiphosphate synthase